MRSFRSEKAFQKWIKKDLENTWGQDAWIFIPPTRSRRGIPDVLGFIRGLPIAWEIKLDGKRADPTREKLQVHTINCIKKAGVILAFARVTPSTYESYKNMIVRKLT